MLDAHILGRLQRNIKLRIRVRPQACLETRIRNGQIEGKARL